MTQNADSVPTARQRYFIDRLQANVDKAEAEAHRIDAIVERHAANGEDVTSPRHADFDEEEGGYWLPSLASSAEGAWQTVARRRKDLEDYLTKLRAKGLEVRHPDAYEYGESWGPDNPAPGSAWGVQNAEKVGRRRGDRPCPKSWMTN